MLILGMIMAFSGYGVGSWGYVAGIKGYNITLREWFSPLSPFTGALDSNGCVPQGSLFPVAGKGGPCPSGSTSSSTSPVQQAQKKNLQTQPNPHGFSQ